MNEDVEKLVADIIARETQVEPAQLTPSSTMDDFDIPSITQLEVLFAIEEAFDIELPEEQRDLTLGGLAELVAKSLQGKQHR